MLRTNVDNKLNKFVTVVNKRNILHRRCVSFFNWKLEVYIEEINERSLDKNCVFLRLCVFESEGLGALEICILMRGKEKKTFKLKHTHER